MGIGPLIGIAGSYVESIFTKHANGPSSTGTPGGALSTPDNQQLSPVAQVLSSLQQLRQANPAQYQQVTEQISANLNSAAQAATANGDSALAGDLTKLSGDFNSASASGQLPNVRDLAQSVGGAHHHLHGHPFEGAASYATSSESSSQTGTTANGSLSPLNIIDNTLSAAGIHSL